MNGPYVEIIMLNERLYQAYSGIYLCFAPAQCEFEKYSRGLFYKTPPVAVSEKTVFWGS